MNKKRLYKNNKNIEIDYDFGKNYVFDAKEKAKIKKNSERLVDPVKEKDFVDYLNYLKNK